MRERERELYEGFKFRGFGIFLRSFRDLEEYEGEGMEEFMCILD
jgi:hypothetical protein